MTLVTADTIKYRKIFGKQFVKKMPSIPAWLNTMAEDANINFSQVLQNALQEILGLSEI